MYFVYAIYNKKSDKIYIGQTSDLHKRLSEHQAKKGNHFTAKFDGVWELIYEEEVQTRSEALLREKQLKSYRGREYIKQYIPR